MTDSPLVILWLSSAPAPPLPGRVSVTRQLPDAGPDPDVIIVSAADDAWPPAGACPRAIRVALGTPAREGAHFCFDDPEALGRLLEILDGRPVASPAVVLREESDQWAVLFDPESGEAVGINPTGVAIWRLLDGERRFGEIVVAIEGELEDVPEVAAAEVAGFLLELGGHGLVGYALTEERGG